MSRSDERSGNAVTPANPTPDQKYERGVGFCRNPDCNKFNDPVFMFGTVENHVCSKCHERGVAVKEVSFAKDPENMIFSEVRIEYDYRPSLIPWVHEGRYVQLAIVRDESCPDQNVYYVRTPVLRTEKQALKCAEGLLGNLAQFPEEVFSLRLGSRPRETIIDLGLPKDEWKAKLSELGARLGASGLKEQK